MIHEELILVYTASEIVKTTVTHNYLTMFSGSSWCFTCFKCKFMLITLKFYEFFQLLNYIFCMFGDFLPKIAAFIAFELFV